MSEVKIAPIPDLGQRTDLIRVCVITRSFME